jgi:hypothetical protein
MNEQLEGSLYCRNLRERIYHVFSLKGSVYDCHESDPCPVCLDIKSGCSK